jgi:hypothetical protein
MPSARTVATPTKSATVLRIAAVVSRPSAMAGEMTLSVTQPRTHASATVSAP